MHLRVEREQQGDHHINFVSGVHAMKIKYHICSICGHRTECDVDICFVGDDSCGRAECIDEQTKQ